MPQPVVEASVVVKWCIDKVHAEAARRLPNGGRCRLYDSPDTGIHLRAQQHLAWACTITVGRGAVDGTAWAGAAG